MKGRMQEDNSQSGSTCSHDQEEEEKTLSQLVILDKDTNVNFAVIKHIWSSVCTKDSLTWDPHDTLPCQGYVSLIKEYPNKSK